MHLRCMYNALSISHGHFSQNHSQKTLRVSYGLSSSWEFGVWLVCLVPCCVRYRVISHHYMSKVFRLMMTSSNGTIFRVTGLSLVNSPHKGQWRGALMFSLICSWINGWVNSREADDLRRHRAHYDVTVICIYLFPCIYFRMEGTCSTFICISMAVCFTCRKMQSL